MLLKIETWFPKKNYTRYGKNFGDRTVHLKKMYKFTTEHFLIGYAIFVFILKNVFKNKKVFTKIKNSTFLTKHTRCEKNVGKQNFLC